MLSPNSPHIHPPTIVRRLDEKWRGDALDQVGGNIAGFTPSIARDVFAVAHVNHGEIRRGIANTESVLSGEAS